MMTVKNSWDTCWNMEEGDIILNLLPPYFQTTVIALQNNLWQPCGGLGVFVCLSQPSKTIYHKLFSEELPNSINFLWATTSFFMAISVS